jgi:RNA polymerase sigma-70 factor, ECF subfamily
MLARPALHPVSEKKRSLIPSPQEAVSDTALVEGLLAGDRRLAGVLYDHLRAPIDGALRRILHQRGPDFEDLVQATFERILRNLADERFEGRSSLKTWACAIASHVALDAIRRKQRERARTVDIAEQDALPGNIQSDKRMESVGELRRIQGILSDMKPELAEALLLHDVLGHKIREIAELRRLTESAAQSRLHRARAELKRRAERPISKRSGSLVPDSTRSRGNHD